MDGGEGNVQTLSQQSEPILLRVMNNLGELAVEVFLDEETFSNHKEAKWYDQVIDVLLHDFHAISRTEEFAFKTEEDFA
ncbi:hypothetical protein VNO77_27702 [Canavalia gladiata]|uniref:Uncharacterized protein n=1 Tax=Canavalia gladiata TaxID=3824 RepID=A0AAN9KWA0_CANGL